jgi:NDP-sugar pyrophosphorylase family protein
MADVAMILGAGRGTRLASIGLRVPKVLVDIAGRPLLDRQIEYLAAEGVRRVVINAHHLGEAIEAFADQYAGRAEVHVVREPHLLGTAGGVRGALSQLGDEPFYVLYGDVVVDAPLRSRAEAQRSRGAAAVVTVYATDEVEGKGTVVADERGWIQRFVEKGPDVPVPALVNAGLYVVDPALIRDLPPGEEHDFGHDVFPAAVARGDRLLAYTLDRPVIDVGTPEGLERARRLAAQAEDAA